MSDKVIDIKTRKPMCIETPDGETQQQFMRRWAKSIKDGKFKNIAVIVMDENRFCDWGVLSINQIDLALFALLMPAVEEQMKNQVFGIGDDEDDDEE